MGRGNSLIYGKVALHSETSSMGELVLTLEDVLKKHGYPEAAKLPEISELAEEVEKEEKEEERGEEEEEEAGSGEEGDAVFGWK